MKSALLVLSVAALVAHGPVADSGTSFEPRALAPSDARRIAPEPIEPNDNRRPGGVLRDGVLTIRLEAREGEWKPEPNGPGLPVFAFAEEGKALRIPGPLIRVPAGTTVRATIRNTLAKPMLVRGLQDHPAASMDSVDIAPGAEHEFVFKVSAPGTHYYFGKTEGARGRFTAGTDSQLHGALVVDPPGVTKATDRIWVMGLWIEPPAARVAGAHVRETMTMNGLSWPYTERLTQTVGDTIRWRVINANGRQHPMHLHGFYFNVESRGTLLADTLYAPDARRLAVTELMGGGASMSFTWVPTRAGNWMFHCHLIAHVTPALRLGKHEAHGAGPMNHALSGMAGLVVGIHVNPRAGMPAMAKDPVARRSLRLFVNERARVYDSLPAYSYVLQEGAKAPAPDSMRIPGSAVVLTKGEPTQITVVNRSSRPATVHWHGIELESFYDGVGDWSGWGTRTAKPIAPRDSFIVRLTPDRAGTFIYHTHMEEGPQLASGLYGPLIILERGEKRNVETDKIILLGIGGPATYAPPVVNGDSAPPPFVLKAGTMYRFRFINITPDHFRAVRLVADTVLQQWRPFAKDGADLPANQATARPSRVFMGAGETYDFEFTAKAPGQLAMEIVSTGLGKPPRSMRVPVNVVP